MKAITGPKKDAFRELVERYVEVGGTVSASLIANAIRDLDTSGLDLPKEIEERL